MANYKRRRSRICQGRGHINKRSIAWKYWLNTSPRSWDILHHTRPRRRIEASMLKAIERGRDPDDVAWPLNNKPHKYYW